MGKFSDLAKQGIRYQPLSEGAVEQAAPEQEQGNFSRGFEKAMLQVPQTLGGTAALVGDLAGADGLREYGLDLYQKNADKIQAITKDSDSLSNVLEGDASGKDWLANSAGYVAGQAIQAVATGGVGGFIGSQLAKRGIGAVVARGANSLAAREVASKVAARGAQYGAGTALLGSNLMQEAGSIYPEALNHAAQEGRELTGEDKARVVGSAVVAAGVDTAMDALMMGRVLKGARKPGESMLRAGVREVPGAMAREGVTEGIQTGIERFGAGQDLNTADAIRDYVDSVGVGLVGGGMGGAASVIRANNAVPESGPLTRAANVATEQQVLQLENNPQPLIAFPDGSVGSQQELHAYLSQYADPEERQRKEHELMGRDPETGKPIEPELQEPAKFAATPEQEAQSLAGWGAQHDAVPIEQAHALLAAPGTKGQSLMVAPHPDGQGFTVVPSNWLTLDSQAKFGDLQKPVKDDAKEKANAVPATAENGNTGADHVAQPEPAADVAAAEPGVQGAVPAMDAAPGAPALNEPEWKTNPYTAYKFADPERAAAFMANRGADPALFEVQPTAGGKFAIKRRTTPTTPTEGTANGADNAVLPQDDTAARGTGDHVAGDAGSGEIVADSAAAPQPGERGTADAGAVATGEPDPVRATGSADADPALSADADWHAFPPDTGTLAIPRAEMPQIKAEHRGAMTNFLNARGITHTQEEIQADQLKPTQAEFSLSKVEQAKVHEGGERSILVSSDGHVLDGHHQWLAAMEKGEPVNAIRLNAPITQLMDVVREFPSATVSNESTLGEAADVPERPQVPDEAPLEAGAKSAQATQESSAGSAPADGQRDDGADIPLAFFAKVKVPHEVHIEETGATQTIDVPADQALASVREDIANLQALIRCMKGGA